MRFSVIIPAFNAEDRIRKVLESVKNQTFTDYELIVVCDSCVDNTANIAREYGAIVDEVKFGRDGLTRNRGIDMAKGEFLLFLDDDDWWLHEYVLEQLDSKLKEVPDVDILCFSFIFRHWKYATPKGNNGRRWIAVWNKCWRREFVGKSRFSAVYSKSDVDFNNDVMDKNPRIVDWDMPLYYYNYLRDGSISEIAHQKWLKRQKEHELSNGR